MCHKRLFIIAPPASMICFPGKIGILVSESHQLEREASLAFSLPGDPGKDSPLPELSPNVPIRTTDFN